MIGPTNAITVTGTIDPGSVTVGSNLKPVKLVNGVATAVENDLVDVASTQTITGQKTFNTRPVIAGTYPAIRMKLIGEDISAPTEIENGNIIWEDKNGTVVGQERFFVGSSGQTALQFQLRNTSGQTVYPFTIGSGSVTANIRAYNASNTTDVVTIGSLQASTDVVHTSGNETISGTKTFNSYPKGIGPVATSINDQQTPNHVLICKIQGLFNGANMRIIVDTIHGQFVITASYYNGFTLYAYYIGAGNHAYTDVHIYQKDGDYYLIIDNTVWNTTFRAYTEITGNFGQTQNYNYLDYSVMALLANLDGYTLSVTASNGGTIR